MVVRDAVVTIFVWGLENGKQPIEQHKNITGSSFEKMTNYLNCSTRLGPLQVAPSLHNIKPISFPQ